MFAAHELLRHQLSQGPLLWPDVRMQDSPSYFSMQPLL